MPMEPVSPVPAVSNEFIDRFAGALKDLAIAVFGQNDKAALITGVVATSLALGAALGVAGARRFTTAVLGFGAFGLVGLWSSLTDPRLHDVLAWVSTAVSSEERLVGEAGCRTCRVRWSALH